MNAHAARHGLAIFLGTAGLSWIVTCPALVHATPFDREMSAMYCVPYNTNSQFGPYSITNTSLSSWIYYSCGVPNDSQRNLTQLPSSGTPIQLYGYAYASQEVLAWACTSHYATTGGACGTASSNSASGLFTLSLDQSIWRSASLYDEPYVLVDIGPCYRQNSACGDYNLVRGYKVTYLDL